MNDIRVLIVDDHEVVRTGLRAVLERTPGLAVAGEAADAPAALQAVRQALPDVVLMDARLPAGDGLEVCRQIRCQYPGIQVIMLTGYTDDAALAAARLAGAGAFLAKDTPCRKLVEHIRAVARGEFTLHQEMNERVRQKVDHGLLGANGTTRTARAGTQRPVALTERERRILSYIVQGQTNQEIAGNMNLCEKTVRNYVSSMLGKLRVSNRAEAASYAVREHILW